MPTKKPPVPIVGGAIQDPVVKKLLDRAAKALSGTSVRWSVGGGIAVGVHGVVRATCDVDVFAADEDRQEILRAFRDEGFIVDKVFDRFHYIAFLPKLSPDPRHRVDLLFPAGEPEMSAIEFPQSARIGRTVFPVFPVELLVLAKFYAGEPTDLWDIAALHARGAFEPDTIRALLQQSDPDCVEGWDEVARGLREPKAKPRRGGRTAPRRARYCLPRP